MMKIKIIYSDGRVVEAEGTAQECQQLLAQPFYSPWWGIYPPSYPRWYTFDTSPLTSTDFKFTGTSEP